MRNLNMCLKIHHYDRKGVRTPQTLNCPVWWVVYGQNLLIYGGDSCLAVGHKKGETRNYQN